MKRLTRIALATGLAAALLTTSAQAGTATDTFQVSITLINACTITVAALNFGSAVSTLASDIDVDTTASVTCTGISPYSISLNAGSGTGSTFATRKMNLVGDTIDYNLYDLPARVLVIGDGTASTVTLPGLSIGGTTNHTIYGRVFAGQDPKPIGTYTSNVIATVTF